MDVMKMVGAAFFLLAQSQMTPAGCVVTDPGDDGTVDEPEICNADMPEEGCPCAEEGTIGCFDDGLVHEEAFMCSDGVWVDAYGTEAANDAFCPDHEDFQYNYCAWVEGEVWSNCTW